ncbi:hypothetical protein E7939_21910 [Salmonella enterica]|nr:hypothetical protein [Salmonella enterica]
MPVRIPAKRPSVGPDPLEELWDNMIDALEDIPIRILIGIIGIVPIVGQPIANALGDWLLDTNDKAVSANAKSDNIATNINNAVNGGSASGGGLIAGVFDAVSNIFGTADSAQKIAIAAQQQIQDLQNETSNPDFNGFAWSTIFSGSDGTPLSSTDWAGSSQIVIRGDSGYAGVAEGSADGHYYKVSQYEFASDTQSASVVLGSRTADTLWTSVEVRCDAGMTQGAFVRANRTTIQLGRFTRSGSTWTWTVWTSQSRTNNQGDILRIRTSGDNYYVLVNGTTVISWTDSGASVSKGAGFRRAGFTEEKSTNIFGSAIASYRLASFAMADWLPAGGGVTTPAWRLRRGAGAAVSLSLAGGETAVLPAGFYTVNDVSSAVTVTNLGTGQITITETGWYAISATAVQRNDITTSADAWAPSPWVLYVDGVAMVGPILSGVVSEVYLAAGQVVRPGISAAWPSSSGGSSGTTARSTITHVSGSPAAAFTGRKIA